MNKLERIFAFSFIGFVLTVFTVLYVMASSGGTPPVFRHFSSDRYYLDTVAPDWANDSTISQKKLDHLNEILSR